MRRNVLGLIAIVLGGACGCGGRTAGQAAAPAITQGVVDQSLPGEDQAAQRVIRDILVNLQEGYPTEQLPVLLPGIRFDEPQTRFLEGSTYLARWDFDGPPDHGRVPVALYFAGEGRGHADLKKVNRAYLVKGSAGRFSVSRG